MGTAALVLLVACGVATDTGETPDVPDAPSATAAELRFAEQTVTLRAPDSHDLALVLTGASWSDVTQIEATIEGSKVSVSADAPMVRVVALRAGTLEVQASITLADGETLAAAATVGVLERHVAPGEFDTTFGRSGLVDAPPWARRVTLDDAANIYLVGGDSLHLYVARLDRDGVPDTAWADGGIYVGPSWEHVQSWNVRLAETDRHGNLFVAGYWGYGTRKDIFIVKLLPNGAPDPSYGDMGIVRHRDSREPYVQGAKLLADGHVLVHARLNGVVGSPVPFGLFAFDGTGRLDASRFGGGVRVLQGDTHALQIAAVHELQDGAFNVAGATLGNGGAVEGIFTVRVERDGRLDTSWSPSGAFRLDVPRGFSLPGGAFIDASTFVGAGRLVDESLFGTVQATFAYPWPSLQRTSTSMSAPDRWDLPTRVVAGPQRTYWILAERRPARGQQNPVSALVIQVHGDDAFPGFSPTSATALLPDGAEWSRPHDVRPAAHRHYVLVELRDADGASATSRVVLVRVWS